MRVIGITLIALTIISCASTLPPADPSANMMEKADTIILTLNKAPSQAYHNFETHLGNQGFTVIRSNEQPLTLETRYKNYDPTILRLFGSYSMKVNATVKDSTLHITG
ncbi:MAG: hypothetical protein GWN00_40125, partial [Aliifodinibius sp.]|nr:hypothetical protein [Fodinibius sp.]NIV16763.1 hypothetical protein [Fodinibius sp.]NIY30764.1 hypothetical protein [Fodinibius sp.]